MAARMDVQKVTKTRRPLAFVCRVGILRKGNDHTITHKKLKLTNTTLKSTKKYIKYITVRVMMSITLNAGGNVIKTIVTPIDFATASFCEENMSLTCKSSFFIHCPNLKVSAYAKAQLSHLDMYTSRRQ